jgi:hypothetical protein
MRKKSYRQTEYSDRNFSQEPNIGFISVKTTDDCQSFGVLVIAFQAISQDFMLGGGVRESMGVQTKSGSAEPGARDFLFGGVQFRLGAHAPFNDT